jgi:hypothetical protein
MSNGEMRNRSGNVNASSRLTSFLYDLMRDHVTPGVVEELVRDSADKEVSYTNGWLAQYAFDLATRLGENVTKPNSIRKDVIKTIILAVKAGAKTPSEAAEQIDQVLRDQESWLHVDAPKVK